MIAYAQPILVFTSALELVPGAFDGTVAVLVDQDNVLSVQPDGTFQTRPRTNIGAWESAKQVGDKLVYQPDGKVYVVPIVEGL